MGLHLLDLLEELLLAVMHLLDPTTIQCLRRTSRIFLRLFSDASFSHWHHPESHLPGRASRLPWYRANAAFERQALGRSSNFRYLMHMDDGRKQCVECTNTNLDNPPKAWDLANKHLFCSACLVDHPKVFFSAAEREKVLPWQSRTCIGHTGYIRLCEHEVITRAHVARRWAAALERAGTTWSVVIRECHHPSHRPAAGHQRLDESPADEDEVWPRAVLFVKNDCLCLQMQWIGHLRLPTGTTREAAVVSRDSVMAGLRELRRGAAEYIFPQSRPGPLPEMRCFDPNRCACFEIGSRGAAATNRFSGWAGMPRRDGTDGCRSDASHRLFPLMAADNQDSSHLAATNLNYAFKALGTCTVSVVTCRFEPCLKVNYQRNILCGPAWQTEWRTVDYSWLEAMDPDSYGLWRDESTKGVLWCLDSDCTNYYRYLERPLIRKCCPTPVLDNSSVLRRPDIPRCSWRIEGVWYNTKDSAAILAEQARLGRNQSDQEEWRKDLLSISHGTHIPPVPKHEPIDARVQEVSEVPGSEGTLGLANFESPRDSTINPSRSQPIEVRIPRLTGRPPPPSGFWKTMGQRIKSRFK